MWVLVAEDEPAMGALLQQGLQEENHTVTLARDGANALKVGPMATQLKVSRGSFYWHFRDIADFRSQVLQGWQERTTEQVIRDLEAGKDEPDRLKHLMRRAFVTKRSLERAIRSWAAEDKDVAATVAAETHGELGEVEEIHARGYWEQVWRRFRRDRLAIASGLFIVLLILVAAVGGPIAKHFLHHGPNDPFPIGGVDLKSFLPIGPFTSFKDEFGHTQYFVLGGDGPLGRDEFLRILYGARVSLEVAVLSTAGVMAIAIVLGTVAGYFRGWIDTVISRILELTMVFPALLFIIALSSTVGPRLNKVTLGVFPQGVITLVLVFTVFGWFYPARIIRAQVLSLREKEFVEAARMVGAGDWRIIRSHLLPHLVAPIGFEPVA